MRSLVREFLADASATNVYSAYLEGSHCKAVTDHGAHPKNYYCTEDYSILRELASLMFRM